MERILIVDDIAENRLYLEVLLRGHGFEVQSACNGAEALALARQDKPDLVVSDILMPVMDGYTLCRECKADPDLVGVPFVFFTATYTEPRDQDLGRKMGAVRYVIKPQEPEVLLGIVKDVLTEVREGRGVPTGKAADEAELSKEYGEAVFRKLEQKVAVLERANQELALRMDEMARAEEERLRLEEQLRASQKLEAIGNLAGGIAHDFNNLLTLILSYTQLTLDAVQSNEQARDYLAQVKNAAERAAALTQQIVAFSRRQMLQPRMMDPNQVISGVAQMLGRIVGEHIQMELKLAPDLGMVMADPGQMEQVIMNLVVNARDAMIHGGHLRIETANVDASAEAGVEAGPCVVITVSDTGCGMDESVRSRVFEPFFTTKEKGKGSGLGLSTAWGIVKQSGGHIAVESALGQGTTFRVWMPRRKGNPAPEVRPAPATGRPAGSETILLVEDEEAIRKLEARILTAGGYSVLSAADGNEALDIAARHSGDIDLLVTDLVVPGMSGRAIAEALRRVRPGIPVLYVSGYADNTIGDEGLPVEEIHFLGKPFSADGLARKVRDVLDGEGADPLVVR